MPSELTLGSLHDVIQRAMGWSDVHLHEFEVDGGSYSADDDELDEADVTDEATVTLLDVAPAGSTFAYTYDFGDGWDHTVEVEDVGPSDDRGPVCVDAERACPPEDCGGPSGYGELLAGRGARFDPEAVDVDEINRSLERAR